MKGRDPAKFIGQKFGRLTVTGLSHITASRGKMWACVCECGGKKITTATHLMNGSTKSCGCLHAEKAKGFLPPSESGFRHLYGNYIQRARNKKIKFDLPSDVFKKLTSSSCVYCGCPPKSIAKSYNAKDNYSFYYYNGLDRIDSSKGYSEDNVEPCCTTCNTMKWVLSKNDFINHIIKILGFQNRKTPNEISVLLPKPSSPSST